MLKPNEERIAEEVRTCMHKQILANAVMFAILGGLFIYGNLRAPAPAREIVVTQAPAVVPQTIERVRTIRVSDYQRPSPSPNYGFPGGRVWMFSSNNWSGYIDIRTDGVYYTHWGWGHWEPQRDGSFLLTNDYDGISHTLRKKNDKMLLGERCDGYWERCDLILDYTKLKQPYDQKYTVDSTHKPDAFDE